MTANELMSIAREELGYIGKRSNKNLDIADANITGKFTKYARDLAEAGYYNGNKNGYDWCCVFIDWCFWIAAGRDKDAAGIVKPNGALGAGVGYSYNYYNAKGRISDKPQVGAQIFYKNSNGFVHTGLVAEIKAGSVITIEGNWNNRVTEREIKLDNSQIAGYGLPFYAEEKPEPEPTPTPSSPDHLHKIANLLAELAKEVEAWANE